MRSRGRLRVVTLGLRHVLRWNRFAVRTLMFRERNRFSRSLIQASRQLLKGLHETVAVHYTKHLAQIRHVVPSVLYLKTVLVIHFEQKDFSKKQSPPRVRCN